MVLQPLQRDTSSSTPDAQVPALLEGVAAKPPQQRDMLLRLAFASLVPFGGDAAPRAGTADDEAVFAAKYSFLQNEADRAAFLDFGLKLLLYAPAVMPLHAAPAAPAVASPAAPPAQASPVAALHGATAAPPPPAKLAPPGLSLADLPRIEGKAPPRGEFIFSRTLLQIADRRLQTADRRLKMVAFKTVLQHGIASNERGQATAGHQLRFVLQLLPMPPHQHVSFTP